MPELTFLSGVASFAATYLMHSTVALIAAILVVRFRQPADYAMREYVWKLAAVVGLFTAAVSSAGLGRPLAEFSIGVKKPRSEHPLGRPSNRRIAENKSPALRTVVNVEQVINTGDSTTLPSPRDALPVPRADAATVQSRPQRPTDVGSPVMAQGVQRDSPALGTIVGYGLASWMVCVMVWSGRRRLRLTRLLAECDTLSDGPVRTVLDHLRRQDGIRHHVTLKISPKPTAPFACGLWKWTIVLPQVCLDNLDRHEIEALLAHELAHLVRRDLLWLAFGRFLITTLPFQPLNRIAVAGWRTAAEYQCDRWATRQIRSPIALARCLIRLAELPLVAPRPVAGVAASGPSEVLVDRVERLLAYRPGSVPRDTRRIRRVIGAIGVGLATLLSTCGPRAVCPAGPSSQAHRVNTSENSAAASRAAQWDDLRAECAQLHEDLRLVDDLLRRWSDNPDVADAATQFRQRSADLDRRLNQLIEQNRIAPLTED